MGGHNCHHTMDDHDCHHHRKKERRKAACAVCILLIILLIMLLLILYFTVFKPTDPRVRVPVMRMVSYNATGTAPNVTALAVGLDLEVYIYNPNRGVFYTQGGSTAGIFYGSEQMGVANLPDNTQISSRSFVTLSVYVGMQRPIILLNMPTDFTNDNISVPISTIVTILGHVTTAGVFVHDSNVVSVCNVNIGLGSPRGYIQPYSCKRSYSLDG